MFHIIMFFGGCKLFLAQFIKFAESIFSRKWDTGWFGYKRMQYFCMRGSTHFLHEEIFYIMNTQILHGYVIVFLLWTDFYKIHSAYTYYLCFLYPVHLTLRVAFYLNFPASNTQLFQGIFL